MPFIYILHFDQKLSHAYHYTGSTTHLQQRLQAHARGAGSSLTRAIRIQGIEWRLGALGTCSAAHLHRCERDLKNHHNAPRHCEICHPSDHVAIPGCRGFAIGLVPFPTTSDGLRDSSIIRSTVRLVTPKEPKTTTAYIFKIMQIERASLGFIPCGGIEGIQGLITTGQILLAEINGQPVGYTAFTRNKTSQRVTIHQCVVEDQARLQKIGSSMIDSLILRNPDATLAAKVRIDLAANHFWPTLDFTITNVYLHKTSGNKIIQYHRLPQNLLERIEE